MGRAGKSNRGHIKGRGKWLGGVDQNSPLSAVARAALQQRLPLVPRHLVRAAMHAPADNVEHVHQLRVATRRAVAAVEMFRDLIPARRRKWLTRKLRHVRRAAGDARDLDVLAQRWESQGDPQVRQAAAVLQPLLMRHRQAAQAPLVKQLRRLRKRQFVRRMRHAIAEVSWKEPGPEPLLAEAAPRILRRLIDKFFALASEPWDDIETLHQIRIKGKKLRYAMELLVGAYDSSFREGAYLAMRDIQEKLGAINDHESAAQRLREWLEDVSDDGRVDEEQGSALKILLEYELAHMSQGLDRFRTWWTVQQSAQLHASLTRYAG